MSEQQTMITSTNHADTEANFEHESDSFAQFLRNKSPLCEEADQELHRHIAKLKSFRGSGVILEAAECWIDKEIADLEFDLRKAGNAA